MIAFHDASLGDVVYTLPLCQRFGVTDYYIKQTRHKKEDTYIALKRLFAWQGIRLHRGTPNKRIDYDFTVFRKHKRFLDTHLIQNYYDILANEDYKHQQFIKEIPYDPLFNKPFVVFNITERYRDSYDWQAKINEMAKTCDVFFIGYPTELKFTNCQYLTTSDLYSVGKLFCNPFFLALFCNPSACLTVAQGLDKQVYLREDSRIKNAHIKRFNEELL